MTKGKWYTRAISVTIALSFILGGLVVAPSVSADPGTSQWEKQATPTDKDLVILPGSDIIDMAVGGSDGKTIYAIGVWYDYCAYTGTNDYWSEVAGPDDLFSPYHKPKLWKSTDGGVTWKDRTDKVLDANNLPDMTDVWDENGAEDFTFFTTVAVAPDDPNFVVVGGWGWDDAADPALGQRHYVPIVVGSNDGADKFYWMGCGSAVGFITALDVSMEVGGKYNIAVGTWDWEAEAPMAAAGGFIYPVTVPPYAAPYGYLNGNAAVWRYEAGSYWSASWVDASGTYAGWQAMDAIADLKFSPNFDVDNTIVVLGIGDASDDLFGPYKGYWIQNGIWGNLKKWNAEGPYSAPVLIKNGANVIVAPIDPLIGSGWDIGALVRRAGHIALPTDYMGDISSGRKLMVAVNGLQFQPAGITPLSEGGYLFWVENTKISEEMLYNEENPYIASLAYHGDKAMMGKTLVGLMFPQGWGFVDIMNWYNGDGVEFPLPVCAGVEVLRSETTDVCCPAWDEACKDPSGQIFATVKFTPDGKMAYAVTQGESRLWAPEDAIAGTWHIAGDWSDESAFSVSGHEDVLGNAWNQSGLIDTDIDFIADVAVASDSAGAGACASACSCVYIGTINWAEYGPADHESGYENKVGNCDSIWRMCSTGGWLRIWHKELQGSPMDPYDWEDWGDGYVEWMVLGLAPEEKGNVKTIYMADLGSDTVWYSTASGSACCPAGLGCWTGRNPGVDEIADIAVLNASTIYVVDFDGDMVKSTTGGRHWSATEETKVNDDTDEWAHHMVAQGDWVLVGGDLGTVSYSKDGGDTFTVLDDIGTGQVHVAFDSYFSSNGYVYAAVAGPDNGVYRTTITAADFKSMDACEDFDYHGIVVSSGAGNPKTSASTGGVLYASYNTTGMWTESNGWVPAQDCAWSGVARLLNPASEQCCGALDWDYLFDELNDEAIFTVQPNNIAICGDQAGSNATIWAIDLQQQDDDVYYDGWNSCYTAFDDSDWGRLWKFTDVFAISGPSLIGVANGATIPAGDCDDCGSAQIVLEWDRLCDACEYDIEIALDSGFKHKVWTTTTIDGAWAGAKINTHLPCDGVVACEPLRAYYKPSDPCAPSIVVPAGALDANTEYFWRVRARFAETNESYRSWWSETWSFNIAIGNSGAVKLTAPDDGATNVPRQNLVFTWTAVSGATGYEMTIWDSNGAEVASSTGTTTSYVLSTALGYDSPYTWQVKAMKGSNVLSTSQVSTFRTMMQPTPPPTIPETVINFPEPAGTPSWVWVVIALAAILIIVVVVLIFRTRRV